MYDMIIELQEAVAHQGEEISRLSDELYAQQKENASLRKEFERLKAELLDAGENESGIRNVGDETPPPHY